MSSYEFHKDRKDFKEVVSEHYEESSSKNKNGKKYIIAYCPKGAFKLEIDSTSIEDLSLEGLYITSVFEAFDVFAYSFLVKENDIIKLCLVKKNIIFEEQVIEGVHIENCFVEGMKWLTLLSGRKFDNVDRRFMQKRIRQEGFTPVFF